MTRVLQVFPSSGSLGFIRGQVDYLREHGFEIEVVTSPDARLYEMAAEYGIPAHGVTMSRSVSPIQDVVSILQLILLFRKRRPQIVHANTVKGGLLGTVAATIANVPVRIYHQHGFSDLRQSRLQDLAIACSERLAAFLATRVISVSKSVRDSAVVWGWWNPGKTVVLAGGSANGVDAVGRFDPAQFDLETKQRLRCAFGIPIDAVVIGFVGRLAIWKGASLVVDAWEKVRWRYPNAVLLLAGELDSLDPIPNAMLQKLGTDTRSVLTGYVGEPAQVFACLDLLLLPSQREGFSTVLLEAAAMEVPAIATNTWGCVDVIEDGSTGTLIPLNDTEALVDAIRLYLDDPELRRQHGKAGRELVLRDFRQEVIWEAVYQEYCRLLAEKGLPIPTPREPVPE